mgnify:FL=1
MNFFKKVLIAVLGGFFLAGLGILIHNSFSPIGLVLALTESAIGIKWIGKLTDSRQYQFLALFSWLYLVYTSGSLGVSQELLISGDRNGLTFFAGGALLNFLLLFCAEKIKLFRFYTCATKQILDVAQFRL